MAGSSTDNVRLIVRSHVPGRLSLGPLSCDVVGPTGDAVEFTLTSGYPEHRIEVPPGRYAIIARRPNGDRLQRLVTVSAGAPEVAVDLASSVGDSPHEFTAPETLRGDIALAPSAAPVVAAEAGPTAPRRTEEFRGFVGRMLNLIEKSPRPAAEPVRSEQRLTVRVWLSADPSKIEYDLGASASSVLKLRIPPRQTGLAVGLVTDHGFGPIVFAPPLSSWLHLTFLADGVGARRSANRVSNPSGIRVPVALATPEEPAIADLLAALASPSVDHPDAIWDQNSDALDPAGEFVSGKFQHPGEALIVAHYLLRFLPERLPLQWADNLVAALPEAADGQVIAAWLRVLSNANDVRRLRPEAAARQMRDRLRLAFRLPLAFLARTRLLRIRGMELFSPEDLPEAVTRGLPAAFFEFGAYAGGLEAFWGTGPFSPGDHLGKRVPATDFLSLNLFGSSGAFEFARR